MVGSRQHKTPAHDASAITIGEFMFVGSNHRNPSVGLQAHEYIHVLQYRAKANFALDYGWNGARFIGIESGPGNRAEAIGYLWEGG